MLAASFTTLAPIPSEGKKPEVDETTNCIPYCQAYGSRGSFAVKVHDGHSFVVDPKCHKDCEKEKADISARKAAEAAARTAAAAEEAAKAAEEAAKAQEADAAEVQESQPAEAAASE
ncbi:MAG: hypothetical protein LBI17_01585 [Rickettsiales bacterium]|nr:hypothetical protein [Rickettsiales bacterium]